MAPALSNRIMAYPLSHMTKLKMHVFQILHSYPYSQVSWYNRPAHFCLWDMQYTPAPDWETVISLQLLSILIT